MKKDRAALNKELKALQTLYVAELPKTFAIIDALHQKLSPQWNDELSHQLSAHFHTLAGSAGSFGCADLGDNARKAEQEIRQILESKNVSSLSPNLSALISSIVSYTPSDLQTEVSISAPYKQDAKPDKASIYILEDDIVFAQSLALQLQGYGYTCTLFSQIDTFQQAVKNHQPDALIIDIKLDEGENAGIQALQTLELKHKQTTPVIMFTIRVDFLAMLEAVRAGANAFLNKPIEIDVLVCELDRLLIENTESEHFRILIIDDDKLLAQHNALLLEQACMETKIAVEPEKVCEIIGEFDPDLILMDVYMPKCSGIELANIIRFYPQYLHIPIVYLSTEMKLKNQLAAMRIGGDDFLTKPISDSHLVEAVRIRAMRAHRLKNLLNMDSLTGLLKHGCMKDMISKEIQRSQRSGQHFSFVMLDLDFFKTVNDEYGHLMGDRVIKTLSRMLKRRVRGIDLASRYGGEEFALVLFNCPPKNASKLVEKLRIDFSKQVFNIDQKQFNATFSAGIAYSKGFQNSDALCQAADQALYQAKNNGRNQTKIFYTEKPHPTKL